MAQTQTAIANVRSRQQWAEIIGADWRQSIDSIIQTGRDLAAAKDELDHGQFTQMIQDDLPFGLRMAQGLMQIAKHPVIGNAQNSALLPATWTAMFELSRLSEDDFQDARNKGLITPELKVKPARAIADAYNKPEGEIIGGAQHMLPSASEARKIARETGRFVAAADGHIYSGATEAESRHYTHKRNIAFKILEAIDTLAEAPAAREWLAGSERHWFVDFRPGAMDDARKWLSDLKAAMEIVDA